MKLSLHPRTNLIRWAFVSVGAAFIAGAGGWMPAYADEPVAEITGIGTLGGSNSTFGAATPDGAFVVGQSYTAGDSARNAFLWSLSSGVMQDLGNLGLTSIANAVTPDGSVVVGSTQESITTGHAFRWTQATGMQDLGDPFGGNMSIATGVSADGSVVIGNAYLDQATPHAFRWTQTTGMQDLGTLGGQISEAIAITPDGSVIVGNASVTSSLTDAFRWTQATGMQDLGNLGGSSYALGVSTDGSVVIGASSLTGNAATHAYRWTQTTGMQDLGTLGGRDSTPFGLNPNATIVVGSSSTTPGSNQTHAFMWTASTNTMQDLGSLFSGASSYANAYALNPDGSVVVGYSSSGIIAGGPPVNIAFRWSQPTGMQSVEDWIVANGGSPLAAGNILNSALFVSVDGNTVIGQGNLNGISQVYIARIIPAAGGGDEGGEGGGEGGEGGGEGGGVLGMDDLENSLKLPLVAGAVIHDQMYSALTTDLEDPRPAKGQYAFSTEGIYGGYSKDEANGYGMSGVFKLVYGLTDTWRVGGSYIWSGDRLDMSTNGQITNNISLFGGIISYGDYKGDGLRGRMAVAYGTGGADLTRNYLTGEGMSQSYGQMSVEQYGYAAEVGYGFRVTPKTLVIPKVSFDWTRSNLGAYAENGGEFPALFNGTTLEDSFLRGGVAVQQAVTPLLNLNFDANYVVRLSSNQDTVSGTLIGLDSLGNFSQTMDLSKDWVELRAGLDFVPDPSAKDFHVTCGLQVNVGEKFDVPAYLVDAGFVVYF